MSEMARARRRIARSSLREHSAGREGGTLKTKRRTERGAATAEEEEEKKKMESEEGSLSRTRLERVETRDSKKRRGVPLRSAWIPASAPRLTKERALLSPSFSVPSLLFLFLSLSLCKSPFRSPILCFPREKVGPPERVGDRRRSHLTPRCRTSVISMHR